MDSVSEDKGVGWKNPPAKEIDDLLKKSKVIAVVGLSSEVSRPSHGVASYLKKQGYTIIPVNPKEGAILGEKSYPDLRSIPLTVDIVDVFRRPDAALSITEEAIAIGAKAVWLQEGIVSIPAFHRGKEAGLLMIMDRCVFKEHSRMINR